MEKFNICGENIRGANIRQRQLLTCLIYTGTADPSLKHIPHNLH